MFTCQPLHPSRYTSQRRSTSIYRVYLVLDPKSTTKPPRNAYLYVLVIPTNLQSDLQSDRKKEKQKKRKKATFGAAAAATVREYDKRHVSLPRVSLPKKQSETKAR